MRGASPSADTSAGLSPPPKSPSRAPVRFVIGPAISSHLRQRQRALADEGALDNEVPGRGVRSLLEAQFLEARLQVADHRHAAAHHNAVGRGVEGGRAGQRSEEHTSELQSLMRISYAVFCLKKKKERKHDT